MDRQIPIYFDNVIIASPIQQVSEANPNLGRLKVGVFTKYGNRNGSYITDEVAEMLINSAIKGDTPVIGFFDPETKSWASHTGPTLASAYGYVETFDGWEPLTDTDGQSRDYAIFTVVLFTKYFDEAKLIVGQHQSMELDINSINGDWADINGIEYYVYTTAAIQGLCVIGSHEPCFSVSSFFSKNDNEYKSQFEKISAFLAEAKATVNEIEKGGEQPMDELEMKETVEPTPEVENESEPAIETTPEEAPVEEVPAEEAPVEEVAEEAPTEETVEEVVEEHADFEALQQQLNDLQAAYDELSANYTVAQNRVQELEELTAAFDAMRAENDEMKATIATYQQQAIAAENAQKNALIEQYEKVLSEEEIASVKTQVSNYSYDTLRSKLAIIFAEKQMAKQEAEEKVPLPEQPESQFALLMKKYRKN